MPERGDRGTSSSEAVVLALRGIAGSANAAADALPECNPSWRSTGEPLTVALAAVLRAVFDDAGFAMYSLRACKVKGVRASLHVADLVNMTTKSAKGKHAPPGEPPPTRADTPRVRAPGQTPD